MPWLHQVFRYCARVDGGLNGTRTICRADTGGHPRGGFDGHCERRGEYAAVAGHHLFQAQTLAVFVGQRQADQAARFAGHEADCLW